MKRHIARLLPLTLVLAVLAGTHAAGAAQKPPPHPQPVPPSWVRPPEIGQPRAQAPAITGGYTFDGEFGGAAGSAPGSQWAYVLGPGASNSGEGDVETYVNNRQTSYQDGNGDLVIKAVKDSSGNWTSAMLTTDGIFAQYQGTFSARIKFPAGTGGNTQAGAWPAFWLLAPDNEDTPAEADVAELYGGWGGGDVTLHPDWANSRGVRQGCGLPNGGDPGNWHVYSITWSGAGFTWAMDGAQYCSVPASAVESWGFANGTPLYIILNVAVGGTPGGTPTGSSIEMDVNWVQVTSAALSTSYSGTIKLNQMGLCLDDRNNSSSNGAVVQVWSCNGLANQSWQVMSDGTIRHNGLCLDAVRRGTANGTKVQLWSCNGGANQYWDTRNWRVNYQAVPGQTVKVLDDTGYGGNGTQVQIWSNNGTRNQIWATG